MEEVILTGSGVRVYAYRNPALHGFYLSLYVRAGSLYESEELSGIGHFLEHVCIRNINALTGGQLYVLLDRYGMEFNAATYNDVIQFYISGASEYFEEGVRMITKLFSPFVLTKEEIDLERRRIKAEIREGDDKNTLAGYTSGVLYPDSSLRLPIVGTNSSVERITRRRLEEHRRACFVPERMFFYVTGNVSDSNLQALCDAVDTYDLDRGTEVEPPAYPRNFGHREGGVFVKNADFTMLRFNFDLDLARVSEAEADLLYDILFSGYSSRFFMELSEQRGLFYDVSGSVDRYAPVGLLYFSFEVKHRDIEETVRLSVDLLRRMKRELLSDADILRAPYVDNAYLLYDDSRELNFTFAYSSHILGMPYRSLEDRIVAYRAVTPERLREIARMIFTSANCTLTIKGNKKKIDTESLHHILLELDRDEM